MPRGHPPEWREEDEREFINCGSSGMLLILSLPKCILHTHPPPHPTHKKKKKIHTREVTTEFCCVLFFVFVFVFVFYLIQSSKVQNVTES